MAKNSPKRGRPRSFDRQQALASALAVFWDKGYDQATMHILSEAMGIGSPSIYCAFGNKCQLFLEALAFYRRTWWQPVFERFLANPDIYAAVEQLFAETPRILLSPDAPCGCITVLTATLFPAGEEEIAAAVNRQREETRNIFRKRLMLAIAARQLPADCNLPALAGALVNFFEGLTLQARGDICQSELLEIARLGMRLLPPRQ